MLFHRSHDLKLRTRSQTGCKVASGHKFRVTHLRRRPGWHIWTRVFRRTLHRHGFLLSNRTRVLSSLILGAQAQTFFLTGLVATTSLVRTCCCLLLLLLVTLEELFHTVSLLDVLCSSIRSLRKREKKQTFLPLSCFLSGICPQ